MSERIPNARAHPSAPLSARSTCSDVQHRENEPRFPGPYRHLGVGSHRQCVGAAAVPKVRRALHKRMGVALKVTLR